MIKAILWDNDGVLVDTERLYYLANKQVFDELGIDLTREMFISISLEAGESVLKILRHHGLPESMVEPLRKKRNVIYSGILRSNKLLNPGVNEVLGRLKGRYIMGIVTSSSKEHFDIITASADHLRFFDFAVTRDDCIRTKPDPEPYIRALEKTGCKAEECIAVEDSERGVCSATTAGIKCIAIPNELTRGLKFKEAYRILDSIIDVPAEIERLEEKDEIKKG